MANETARRPVRRLAPRPQTQKTRDDLLEAAVEIFGAKGYSEATMAEIGERVGMTHAGVRHYFGSKDNLLLEAVKHRDTADLSDFSNGHMPSGLGQFEHLAETAAKNAQRPGIVQSFIVLSAQALTEDSPTAEYFRTRYANLRKEIADNFRELCAEAGVVDEDVIAMASANILALMDGLQYQWVLDPTQLDLGKATAFGINAILKDVLGVDFLGNKTN